MNKCPFCQQDTAGNHEENCPRSKSRPVNYQLTVNTVQAQLDQILQVLNLILAKMKP